VTTILVAPAKGRRVVTPQGVCVPEKFRINPRDPYWARALRDGDLVEAAASDATTSTGPAVAAPVSAAGANASAASATTEKK